MEVRMEGSTPPAPKEEAFGTLAELEKVKRELELSRAQVVTAQAVAEKVLVGAKTRHRNKMALRVVAVFMMSAALIKLAYLSALTPQPVSHVSPPMIRPGTFNSVPAAAVTPVPALTQDAEMNLAFARLSNAFHSFPDRDQKDIVNEVNRKNPGVSMACRLSWKDGTAALLMGGKDGDALTITTALNGCATEVEKLHSETLAKSE